VSLPTWKDNIKYEEGDAGVIEKIKSAYPRFKIHYLIEKVIILTLITAAFTTERYPILARGTL